MQREKLSQADFGDLFSGNYRPPNIDPKIITMMNTINSPLLHPQPRGTSMPMIYARRVDGGVDPVLTSRRLSRPRES